MKTVKLSKPITAGDKTVSELTFREATVGDLVLGSTFKSELAQTVAILAAISDTPLPVFHQVSARDLNKIMSETAEYLGNETTTGE